MRATRLSGSMRGGDCMPSTLQHSFFVGWTDYATRNSAAGQRFERQVDNAVSPVPTSSVAPKAHE